MDRSADMALPEAPKLRAGGKAAPYRHRRFGKLGIAKPTGDDNAGRSTSGTSSDTGQSTADPEALDTAVPEAAMPGTAAEPAWPVAATLTAAPAGTDKPDLSAAVKAAQDGDEHAFRVLYRDMQPRLLRYLRAMVGEDAEDIASEAWLHIARDLPGFSGDSDGFRGWAATIARHRATDHQRRHRRRPQPAATSIDDLADLAGGDDTAQSALDVVSTESAVAMIAELPRDQAEAVLLRVVVGLDAESAGKVLGKRSGAVRTATYRGLKRLAARLEQSAGQDQKMGTVRRLAGRAGKGGPPVRRQSEE